MIQAQRIHSIDALRGLTILAMVFVNDIAGIKGLPWWMYHMAATAGRADYNGMTPVDWVFPGFLFVMGMSTPVAMRSRSESGESRWRIGLHVLIRAASLILLGWFKVNQTGAISALRWPSGLWNAMMFGCAIAAFAAVRSVRATLIMRGVGFASLAVLAVVRWKYVGPMFPQWWEILGIIGWAYLGAAVVWMIVGDSRAGLTAAIAMLFYLFVLETRGLLKGPTIRGFNISEYFGYGTTFGTHAAIAVCGMFVATFLQPAAAEKDARSVVRFVLCAVAAFLLGAIVAYPHYHVNKDAGTPSWGLICAGVTAVLFLAIWYFVDFRGNVRPSWLLRVAGQNALLIYLLQSMLYPLMQLIADAFSGRLYFLVSWHAALGSQGVWLACARGAIIAISLALLSAGMSRAGLRLRL